jgi:stage III sporulation protein AB
MNNIYIYIKLTAACLVIAASAGIGRSIGRMYDKMTDELKELILFAGIMKGQLRYAITEIVEILEQSAEKTHGVIAGFLKYMVDILNRDKGRSFAYIWNEGIIYLKTHSHLNEEQINMVCELGQLICYMDVEGQIANIELWEKNMCYEYERQRERTNRINKVACSLGILGGILIVIIML